MQHQTLEARIDFIAQFRLSDQVPEGVQIHFETGRNLFLYAWYVYRFHMVAEHHVLATLEMAARVRLKSVPNYTPPRGLFNLLNAARAAGLIANERFIARNRWALERARWRHDLAEIERMVTERIDESVVDYKNVEATDEDLSHDWLQHFIKTLPQLRNMHAHGSRALDPTVGRTFEIVVELINQLFQDCSVNAETDGA
jgi:hypothetical protein